MTIVDPELEPTVPAPAPAPVLPPWLDLGLRVTGFVLALLLAALTAAFEAFLAPLYWGSTRVPVAPAAAVVCNLALVWFTVTVTGRRMAAIGPAVVWVIVMIAAASRTAEGDLVLTDSNWVGIGTMLAGCVAFAGYGYRLVLTGVPPSRRVAGQRGGAGGTAGAGAGAQQ